MLIVLGGASATRGEEQCSTVSCPCLCFHRVPLVASVWPSPPSFALAAVDAVCDAIYRCHHLRYARPMIPYSLCSITPGPWHTLPDLRYIRSTRLDDGGGVTSCSFLQPARFFVSLGLFFVLFCWKVSEQRVGDGELIFFKGTKTQASCTIVLRGANDFMLDEMDR